MTLLFNHANSMKTNRSDIRSRPQKPSKKVQPNSSTKCDHCGITGHQLQTCNKLGLLWLSQAISNQNDKSLPPVQPPSANVVSSNPDVDTIYQRNHFYGDPPTQASIPSSLLQTRQEGQVKFLTLENQLFS